MTTRRVLFEECLNVERIHIWCDLVGDVMNGKDPSSDRIIAYVGRIRMIGEALGYPSRLQDLPQPAFTWYRLVEDVPALGLNVDPDAPWPTSFALNAGQFLPVSEHLIWFHVYGTPDDPDEFDWQNDG